ncbi:glutamate-5-semialdehyde dehydrogenase [Succinimonas amylolytica]|uniref:glutamate-5-semialdehyde dehydrogenase n=1 Tax=Succinimonas amylolytica TaxID=83769 RepID=UPI000477D77C|nr:glutamate-5-semialdehyde dehydrogenase [Succinimonas amylolytica]
MSIEEMGRRAKEASHIMAGFLTRDRNRALESIRKGLENAIPEILKANEEDLTEARAKGIGAALLDRLTLNEKRLQGIIADIGKVAGLQDPVGEEFDSRVLPNGLRLRKRRVPLGVLGVIYEARPNVTVDITSLSVKTGNACILRGGKETLRSNTVLVTVIRNALKEAGFPEDAVQYISDPNREYVNQLLKLDRYVDMIIPRGGQKLQELCRRESTVPVIIGGFGIGHIFVDASADPEKSLPLIGNSKIQRPSACNAVDTVLVHQALQDSFIPRLAQYLAERDVELVAHGRAWEILKDLLPGHVREGQPADFDVEWLSLKVNIAVVDDLNAAVAHLRAHGAVHSDAILTNDYENALTFMNAVDSACVYVNASTRFSDGGQFGLGAEVAISTQKLHARGPMGLQELTTYKWICEGSYSLRE